MEEFSPQVQALDDRQLEGVSGGDNSMNTLQLIAIFLPQCQALGQQLGKTVEPLLNKVAFDNQYGDAMKILDTYNNCTKFSKEELASKYAESWNSTHSNDFMPDEVAAAILSIPNPCDQAVIACAGSVKDIVNAYANYVSKSSAS